MIRCKMRLQQIVPNLYSGTEAIFRCEYDAQIIAEDKGFSAATPQGVAHFVFDNQKAAEQLIIGQTYYFDIVQSGK